ncbi:MAG: CotH kinase family protein, partial [Oscillospiraceae bacterium]|nr:CotH kinase family protein [Oscillospiraceae bacterium]
MKKILAVVLVLLMALQMAPFAASAEELPHDHDYEEETFAAALTEEEPAAEEPAPEDGEEVPVEIPEAEPTPAGTDLRSLEIPAAEPALETDAVPAAAEPKAVSAPATLWVEPAEGTGMPSRVDVFKKTSGSSTSYLLCLPGSAVLSACRLSWDGGSTATVDGTSYASGECPVPGANETKSYTFKNGSSTLSTLRIVCYQGSAGVNTVFIEIDESQGTIADMKKSKDNTCTGIIYINGTQYALTKMKGRGNATWTSSDDKKPYNLTLGKKINFPGIASDKTKKWSFLAEALDRSLLCNRSGFLLAEQMGIGQSTTSADVWMNGEYQGCYTVTPKTDSFVAKNGWMIEQDNYLEDSVAEGGDPQFKLDGLKESSGWSSAYNRITVKKMGDDFLGYDENGEVDESVENMEAKAAEIQSWLQDAWDAIRSDTGYNSKGKYYTDYIDIESFAKMYLMHEYVKNYDVCAGSILFHRDGQTDADKLIAGPIWDLDNALGSTCSNSNLGSESDRRSAQGHFVQNITEYKTSIYKTLRKHADFLEEVSFQYNRYRDYFDALPAATQQLIDGIADSAAMNHAKVNDLGNGQYQNLHYYRRATTLGSGDYSQSYVATTSWSNYTANLKTYITTRSLWFHNNYYDANFVDPATCEHQYAEVIDPAATCTAEGLATYTCPICKDSYKVVLPKIPHDYQDGACTVCGEVLVTAAISCSQGASVTVYEMQSLESPHVDNAAEAHPRNSDTGLIDCAGDGQINFVVRLQEGFVLDSVSAAP